MRPLFIAGNWKMNPTTSEAAIALAEDVKAGVSQESLVRVAFCPPSVFLQTVDRVLENSPIGLGGQNMHAKPEGAYTGELAGAMLVDCGCTHVILGHSERRHGMHETSQEVNDKLRAALAVQLIPIVCVGETLDEREAGETDEVVRTQLETSLTDISAARMAGIVLAYEPVWAIGTGKTATPAHAQHVHAFIRHLLRERFGEATSTRVIVQYGGSVKPENAAELLACPDIDGALVGGASLKAVDFLGIIQAAQAVALTGKP